jgi:hypothetical protein
MATPVKPINDPFGEPADEQTQDQYCKDIHGGVLSLFEKKKSYVLMDRVSNT